MKRIPWLAALIPALLFGPACGKKGPILAPLVLIPQKVETLKALQIGGRILLEWTNPESYIDGRALAGISGAEVWVYEKSYPAKTVASPPSAEEFEVHARRAEMIDESGEPIKPVKDASKKGRSGSAPKKQPPPKLFQYSYALSPNDLKGMTLTFGLKVKDALKGRLSEFSKLVTVTPQVAPLAPRQLHAAVFGDRIDLRWEAPAANFDGSTPAAVKGYNVYRLDKSGKSERLNAAPVAGPTFADKTFLFGRDYRYVVRASTTLVAPFLESDDSPGADVLPKDIFPPLPPAGLSAAAGPDFITLIWDANREKDLAGYRVWRKEEGGGSFIALAKDLFLESTYTDRAVEKSRRYEYAITAVDALGNESPMSAVVSVIIKDPGP
jgi:hypothetical protein